MVDTNVFGHDDFNGEYRSDEVRTYIKVNLQLSPMFGQSPPETLASQVRLYEAMVAAVTLHRIELETKLKSLRDQYPLIARLRKDDVVRDNRDEPSDLREYDLLEVYDDDLQG